MLAELPLDKLIFGFIMDIFILVIFIVCILEVRRYFKKKGIISGKQLTVRVIAGILLMIIMVQVQYGIYWVDPEPGAMGYFVDYWSRCLLVTFMFFITGLIDLYLTMQIRRRARKGMKHIDHVLRHTVINEQTGTRVAVLITDSHGRPFRLGTVGTAIGVAGFFPLWDRRGERDLYGYRLQHTEVGLGDEMAAAASLLMGQAAEGTPAVILRGLTIPEGEGAARDLVRPLEMDLYR